MAGIANPKTIMHRVAVHLVRNRRNEFWMDFESHIKLISLSKSRQFESPEIASKRRSWKNKGVKSQKGTFYLSGFDGLPCGRREVSRPSFLAIVACQRLSPKGVPRARLCRSDLSSASVCTPLRDASSAKASGSDRRTTNPRLIRHVVTNSVTAG